MIAEAVLLTECRVGRCGGALALGLLRNGLLIWRLFAYSLLQRVVDLFEVDRRVFGLIHGLLQLMNAVPQSIPGRELREAGQSVGSALLAAVWA